MQQTKKAYTRPDVYANGPDVYAKDTDCENQKDK